MDAFLTVTLMTLIAGVGGTGLGGILGALVRTESNRIVSLLLSATRRCDDLDRLFRADGRKP